MIVLIDEEAPEDAASRWREGVLEDAGASSSFASVFNLETKVRQSSSAKVAAVRQEWSPAASQVFHIFLLLVLSCCWSCHAAVVCLLALAICEALCNQTVPCQVFHCCHDPAVMTAVMSGSTCACQLLSADLIHANALSVYGLLLLPQPGISVSSSAHVCL